MLEVHCTVSLDKYKCFNNYSYARYREVSKEMGRHYPYPCCIQCHWGDEAKSCESTKNRIRQCIIQSFISDQQQQQYNTDQENTRSLETDVIQENLLLRQDLNQVVNMVCCGAEKMKGIQDVYSPWTLKQVLPMPLLEQVSYSGNYLHVGPISHIRSVSCSGTGHVCKLNHFIRV